MLTNKVYHNQKNSTGEHPTPELVENKNSIYEKAAAAFCLAGLVFFVSADCGSIIAGVAVGVSALVAGLAVCYIMK